MQDFMATQNFYDPKVSILVGIVFLLREIELANATRSRVTVEEHDKSPQGWASRGHGSARAKARIWVTTRVACTT